MDLSDGPRPIMFQRLKPVSPLRFAVLAAAWGLVVFSCFLMFEGFFRDRSDPRKTELAFAKAKLEARWGTPLPANLEVVGSIPNSGVASADWDLAELGCSSVIYPTATLQLQE
jgi:hypothetical protein